MDCEHEAEREFGTDVGELREALDDIRGVVLGPLSKRDKLIRINEIVGMALYGDFAGALARAPGVETTP